MQRVMYKFLSISLVSVLIICSLHSFGQFYNGSHQEFGKNRVQYREFLWSIYKFQRFDIYFYRGGKEIAIYTAKSVDKIIEETEDFFDYGLEDKIQFIIYNKLSDLRQSNIGLTTDEQSNIGGVTRIVGSKIFLYFEGDQQKLLQQIRAGVAEILLSQMMYGGNWKDRVKNSTLLTLPDWYVQGLISYTATGWNVEIENRVRDGILSGRYAKFNHLTGEDAIYAGHSIWNFIVERYGESLIPSIIYMTKISRNIESGFLFVLGTSLKSLTSDWLDYYHNKFYNSDKLRNLPNRDSLLIKPKKARVYSQLKASPDGRYAAFVTNQIGKYKVWIYDFNTQKKHRILKTGFKLDRLNDYSYPLLTWHPSGKFLSIITEKKDKIMLAYYTLSTKKTESRELHNFQKILDFSYSNDGKKLVLSAVQKGQSDIFVYNVATNTYEQITKDLYDDLYPRFIHNSKEIIFSSNRASNTIRLADQKEIKPPFSESGRMNKDLFLYDYNSKSDILKRVTNTPSINEIKPIEYDSLQACYLSDNNGIINRYLVRFDSIISHIDTVTHYRHITTSFPVTNYSRNIIENDVNLPSEADKSKKLLEIIYSNERFGMYAESISQEASSFTGIDLKNTAYRAKQNKSEVDEVDITEKNTVNTTNPPLYEFSKEVMIDTTYEKLPDIPNDSIAGRQVDSSGNKNDNQEEKEEKEERVIDINNYVFESEIARQSTIKESKNVSREKPRLAGDTTSIDDSEDVEHITYITPSKFSAVAKQWNYNTAFSTDYFMTQLDNSYLNVNYQPFTGGGPIYTNPGFNVLFKIGISDLFEDYKIVGGIRLSGNFNSNEYFLSFENLKKRLDKQIVLHRQGLLVFRDNKVDRIHTHDIKYVLKWPFNEVMSIRGTVSLRNDRTAFLSTDIISLQTPNIYDTWGGLKGEFVFDNTRIKGLNLYNGTRYKVFAEWYNQIDEKPSNLFVFGVDFRNYLKIHRDLIWANRFAASTSLGSQRLIYYLGGVDGWLRPEFDQSLPPSPNQNYAYQTLATNMRGFIQNVRNGNSFAVINSELRLPVVKYLLNRPLKSDFLENFQIVGFADIGTAWTGKTPYSSDNSLNTKVIVNGPITITLIQQKEPIVAGYGLGIRGRLWGYFIRVDWAKGIEDGIVLPHIWYLSLSLDF